jgi:hypothetical protein
MRRWSITQAPICATLEDDWNSRARKYDGMLYNMLTKEEGQVIALYIGKAETLGRQGNLSANIKGVSKNANKGKFARWGDGRQYHIEDLSAAVLCGYEAEPDFAPQFISHEMMDAFCGWPGRARSHTMPERCAI